MRESEMFTEENDENWLKRSEEESKRIKKEDRDRKGWKL
jgi:hypothetical protein